MDQLTPELAFRVREMHAEGLWSGRIAEMLGLEPDVVQRAIYREPEPEDVAEHSVAGPSWQPRPKARPDPNAWPPPVDDSTEWDTVSVSRGYGQGAEQVRVRWVLLWGKRVRINDSARVWCHYCLEFKTTAELSHPWNGCPVGLPYRGGLVTIPDTSVDDEPRYLPVSRRRDPIWGAW